MFATYMGMQSYLVPGILVTCHQKRYTSPGITGWMDIIMDTYISRVVTRKIKIYALGYHSGMISSGTTTTACCIPGRNRRYNKQINLSDRYTSPHYTTLPGTSYQVCIYAKRMRARATQHSNSVLQCIQHQCTNGYQYAAVRHHVLCTDRQGRRCFCLSLNSHLIRWKICGWSVVCLLLLS